MTKVKRDGVYLCISYTYLRSSIDFKFRFDSTATVVSWKNAIVAALGRPQDIEVPGALIATQEGPASALVAKALAATVAGQSYELDAFDEACAFPHASSSIF